jgi:broad specificity phosphatase PhoE
MARDSPARLILVRHGETVGRSSIRYYGRTDVALSELGRAQMRAVREWLARQTKITHFAPVWSSPLCRAAEGARIICPDTHVIEVKEFVEVDFGLFEGLTNDEIRERHPVEYARWNRDRLASDYAYPGGESRAAFTARVARGLLGVTQELDGGTVDTNGAALIVAHRGVIRAIAQRLAGVEPNIELASIHILRRAANNTGWEPEALDVTTHLASHRS